MSAIRSAAPLDTRIPSLFIDMRLLLILFVAFRVGLLLVYQPLLLAAGERGITVGGDFLYYFQLGALSDRGLLPFRDWWSEFPPIPSYLDTLVYQLTGRGGYGTFAVTFAAVMIAFDAANLLLIRRIGGRLHGAMNGMMLAWIYALLLAPAIFLYWDFEAMVAFFLLLSLSRLLEGRIVASTVWAAVGTLTKFTPAILLGVVWRFRARTQALRYTLILAAIVGGVYLILFAQNAVMTAPSLTAQFNKASYQTVWALLDGNLRTGNFGAPEERLDPANAAVIQGNPARVPGWVRLGVAVVIGVFVFLRTRRFDDKGLVTFVAVSLLIFFLQAQGWSPQWLVQIIPLLLLVFPTRNGVLIAVLLTFITFTEYPFLFLRTGDTDGVITGALLTPFTVLVITRTVLLIGCVMAMIQKTARSRSR